MQFLGPVRPRLQLTQITINSELTNFVQGAGPAGAERILGDRLASGWIALLRLGDRAHRGRAR